MKIRYDYGRLRQLIYAKFDGCSGFADAMGLTATTVRRKLANKSEWSQAEIASAVTLLAIPVWQVSTYFFCVKS